MAGVSPFKGKSVLELGAGCGLVGIVLAKLGAASVTLTDLEPALPLLSENIQLNKAHACNASALSWGSSEALRALTPPFDYVIGADIMYIIEVIDLLVVTLRHAMGKESVCYMGYGRNRRALETFLKATLDYFCIEELESSQFHPDFFSPDMSIIKLTLKS